MSKPKECTNTQGNVDLNQGRAKVRTGHQAPTFIMRKTVCQQSLCALNTQYQTTENPLYLLYLCNTYLFFSAAQEKEKWKIKNLYVYTIWCYIPIICKSCNIFFLLLCSCSLVLKDNTIVSSTVTPRNEAKWKWSREELRERMKQEKDKERKLNRRKK